MTSDEDQRTLYAWRHVREMRGWPEPTLREKLEAAKRRWARDTIPNFEEMTRDLVEATTEVTVMSQPKTTKAQEEHDDDGPSISQIAYVEAADELREALRKRINFLAAGNMSPAEAYQLTLALNQCIWFDINCRSFDHKLAEALDRKPWEDDDE